MEHHFASITFLVSSAVGAATGGAGFDQHVVTLPVESPTWMWPYWIDVDGDSRTDVFVVTLNDNRVYFYHQEPSGFADRPSQVVTLPRGTAWFALRDVDRRPGLELVSSGPEGLAYFRQAEQWFESSLQKLLEAEQVFNVHDEIVPIYHPALPERRGKLPVTCKDTMTVYEIDAGFGVTAGRQIDLKMTHGMAGLDRDRWDRWALGSRSARGVRIETTAREASTVEGATADDEGPNLWLERLQEESPWSDPVIERQDINTDGREDVVLWAITGWVDAITKAVVFLRTDQGTLPEKPTQIVRLRGVPVSRGGSRQSLLHDLDGDGRWVLLLLAFKAKRISLTTVFEAYLTKGLDAVMEIRCLEEGQGYARRPTASVECTVMLPDFGKTQTAPLVFFEGDFNGDACRDMIVPRSPTHILIYLSSPAGRFFERTPALAVDIPFAGEMIMADLNGDERSDIMVVDQEKARIAFMLSQPALREEPHR